MQFVVINRVDDRLAAAVVNADSAKEAVNVRQGQLAGGAIVVAVANTDLSGMGGWLRSVEKQPIITLPHLVVTEGFFGA